MAKRSKTTLIGFVILLLLFLALNFAMVAPYLLALVMGGLLSITAKPLYRNLRGRGLGPKLASFLVVLATVGLVVIPVGIFTSVAVRQAIETAKLLIANKENLLTRLPDLFERWPLIREYVDNPQDLQTKLGAGLQNFLEGGTSRLLNLLGGAPEFGLQIAVAMITMFFLLVDGERFLAWFRSKVPLDRDVWKEVIDSVRFTTISTIWATVAAAGTQATILFVAYVALGVPQSFLAAGATFVFAWIPVLGSTPVWIVGALYLYFKATTAKAIVMIGMGLIASVSDNLVRPMILKGKSDMHPLVSLVSIFGGLHLFGIWGVFLGPILTAVLLALLEVWPRVASHFGFMENREVIAEEAVPASLVLGDPVPAH